LSDDKSEIKVAVQDGFIGIKTLQVAGKKKMQVVDFMRGFKFAENARFC
jgi:methionyl-tRNA formyltransferase